MITEAIILAGGFGTRLQTIVKDVPKPMALIGDRPFLSILIDIYRAKGIKKFVLSLHHKPDIIIDYFKDSYRDVEISFVVEEKPLGTGGAIRLAATKLQTEHALVLNGDSFLDFSLQQANELLEKYNSTIIFGRHVIDSGRYGRIEHIDGLITKFEEKKDSNIGVPAVINAGIYVMHKNLLDKFKLNEPFSIERDYFDSINKEQGFRLVIADGYFIDIGLPEDYLRAQQELRQYINA